MAKKKRGSGQMGRPPRGGRGGGKSRMPRIVGGIAVVAVLGIVVAAASWWFLVREDAQLATSPLAISTTESQETATAVPTEGAGSGPGEPTATDGSFVFTIVSSHPSVDGTTEAAYFAGEKLARLSVPSTAKGTTNDVTGQIVLDASGLSPEAETVIVVGLTSLRSDEGRRESRVQQALQTSAFPEATFVATELSGYPTEFPENAEVAMELTGLLTIHGVESEVTWNLIATRAGDVLTALATFETRYEDWNVPVLNIGGFVTVEEDVTLQIQIIAVAS